MYNLLKKPKNTFKARKNRLMWGLILICGALACFSIASASNFLKISLDYYSVPAAISIAAGIAIAMLVDFILGDSLQQLSLDYFRFKDNPDRKRWLDPATVIIALAFGALSWYMSQEGSDLKATDSKLELAKADTIKNSLTAVLLSPLTEIPEDPVKTKDMNWTQHKQLLVDKEAAIQKNATEKERLLAAKELSKIHSSSTKEINESIESIFDQNKDTLLYLLILYCIGNIMVGYYKSVLEDSPTPTLVDINTPPQTKQPKDEQNPMEPGPAIQRPIGFSFPPKDITHDSKTILHDFRVNTENQSIRNEVRICNNCGSTFDPNHKKQKFCCDGCRYEHHNKKKK